MPNNAGDIDNSPRIRPEHKLPEDFLGQIPGAPYKFTLAVKFLDFHRGYIIVDRNAGAVDKDIHAAPMPVPPPVTIATGFSIICPPPLSTSCASRTARRPL